jgi:hypothetical protein
MVSSHALTPGLYQFSERSSRISNHMALRMAKLQASPSPNIHEKYHMAAS